MNVAAVFGVAGEHDELIGSDVFLSSTVLGHRGTWVLLVGTTGFRRYTYTDLLNGDIIGVIKRFVA